MSEHSFCAALGGEETPQPREAQPPQEAFWQLPSPSCQGEHPGDSAAQGRAAAWGGRGTFPGGTADVHGSRTRCKGEGVRGRERGTRDAGEGQGGCWPPGYHRSRPHWGSPGPPRCPPVPQAARAHRASRHRGGRRGEMGPAPETGGRRGFYFHYWALFDGHAGSGAAVLASKRLHLHICEQLRDLVDILRVPPPEDSGEVPNDAVPRFHLEKEVSHESLVIGAIENAFKHMVREAPTLSQRLPGGCCALAAVYLMGKFYVANAGDSRYALYLLQGLLVPGRVSRHFVPQAFLRPELLGKEFTHLEFPRRIQPKELGKKMLYRDQNMNGWAYKKVEEDDLKFPLIYGEGKKARVMATIGVTRGLGDHDLKVFSSNIHIKPFLSCFPEVRVYDLTEYEHCPDDVLVLGTDGLWDVTNDKEVAGVVMEVLASYEPNDPCRYTMVAQELVLRSRGVLKERGWRLANDKLGSGDDISVFVIPLGGPGNYT
uniref:Protein phosphatase, Mg2+/Mn2+ dependent 1J n=1 Tax=Athene cunicularia TaxID=194338 RepID=A0A663MHU8_ATHCN